MSTQQYNATKRTYQSLLIAGLLLGESLLAMPAHGASPPPGTVIENQATGSYLDTSDGLTKTLLSDKVSITVAEVAGISVIASGVSGIPNVGNTVYFSFTITNAGNDPTQFFIPDAPAAILNGSSQNGPIQVVEYDADGSGATVPVNLTTNNITVPLLSGGQSTGSLLNGISGTNNGSIPPGGTVTVRVPVLVAGAVGSSISVTLGDTNGRPSAQNQPYIQSLILGLPQDLYTVDNADGSSGEFTGTPINGDVVFHRQEASAIGSTIVSISNISISGTVFNDADASVTINGSDAGTNASSTSLTIYAINSAGKVADKATVNTNGVYTLSNVPANASLTLRLSNDSSFALGDTAPLVPSRPSGWFHTGENKGGTIDAVIATLGDIALTTITTNITQQDFGIRQSHTIAADPAPTTCAPDFRTTINTGIDASGVALSVGSNDLNWTAEWIAGPASGLYTPYATPRPVGVMPAVVTGKLAGTWINELPNAKWISYPFRIAPNSTGDHRNANLDGSANQQTDTVRVKYTATVTLPSNANTISVSIPVGVSVDNQFVSAKVNGVENITTPTQNAYALGFTSLQSFNLSQGWQAGVNTIEIVTDSGPPLTGFFLSVNAATTQVCNSPNVLLVKRITGVNGSLNNGGISLGTYDPETNTNNPSYPYDKNVIQAGLTPPSSTNWPNTTGATSSTFLLGARDGGTTKTRDEIEYTIYFLSTGIGSAKNVTICDRIPRYQTFVPDAFNSLTAAPNTTPASPGGDRGIQVSQGTTTYGYTNIGDGDAARYYPPQSTLPTACKQPALEEDNGAIVVNLGDVPNATAPGNPINSYGFIRFRAKVK